MSRNAFSTQEWVYFQIITYYLVYISWYAYNTNCDKVSLAKHFALYKLAHLFMTVHNQNIEKLINMWCFSSTAAIFILLVYIQVMAHFAAFLLMFWHVLPCWARLLCYIWQRLVVLPTKLMRKGSLPWSYASVWELGFT